MLEERSVAAETGENGLAGFGVQADLARQRQKLSRLLEVDVGDLPALRQGRPLGFLAVAALDIGSERPERSVTGSPVSGSVPRSFGSFKPPSPSTPSA